LLLLLPLAVWSAACSSSHARPITATPVVTTATPAATPTPVDLASQIGVRAGLPQDDPIALAARYRKTQGRAPATKPFTGEANVGDSRAFTVVRLSAASFGGSAPPTIATITATLLARSAHAYFYEDTALDADPAAVQQAADKFETTVWPRITGVFGLPAIPGVDGDPRIIVLQSDLGGGAGGYFSTDDLYLKAVRPYSNEAEMVYMDRTLKVGGDAFNVVLAHEFQHLIHANDDLGEEAWVNEGLSEDASGLVGGAVSSVRSFEAHPETPLTDWESGSLAHYGAGSSFFRYLASRFGGDSSLGAIAREQGDGTAGVDEFLASVGQSLRFRDVFADWIAANILSRESGPYGNPGHPLEMDVQHELASGASADGDAHQFGSDYYTLTGLGGGDHVIHFEGRPTSPILPADPPGGGPVLWGNAEDGIDTTLTRPLDLTGATNPVLTFKTWFDVERWYDWGYVAVSMDGGATWEALPGQQTTTDDPVLAAYGPGYSGKSGGGADAAWVDERVSLAKFAGMKILLRFEYVTDGATHGAGWAIAEFAVEGSSVRDPGFTDSAWSSDGWVRIDDQLPQTYIVRLIEDEAGGASAVLDVPLDQSGTGDLRFNTDGVSSATLVVAGSTEGTTVTAPYHVDLRSP
jgi:immune inhibitor A